MDLNSVNASNSAGTIQISFTETDFEYDGVFEMQIGGTTNGTVVYQLYQNDSNTEFGTADLVGTIGPLGAGAFASPIYAPGVAESISYSLTQTITISHRAGGVTSFDAVATVPEPTSSFFLVQDSRHWDWYHSAAKGNSRIYTTIHNRPGRPSGRPFLF